MWRENVNVKRPPLASPPVPPLGRRGRLRTRPGQIPDTVGHDEVDATSLHGKAVHGRENEIQPTGIRTVSHPTGQRSKHGSGQIDTKDVPASRANGIAFRPAPHPMSSRRACPPRLRSSASAKASNAALGGDWVNAWTVSGLLQGDSARGSRICSGRDCRSKGAPTAGNMAHTVAPADDDACTFVNMPKGHAFRGDVGVYVRLMWADDVLGVPSHTSYQRRAQGVEESNPHEVEPGTGPAIRLPSAVATPLWVGSEISIQSTVRGRTQCTRYVGDVEDRPILEDGVPSLTATSRHPFDPGNGDVPPAHPPQRYSTGRVRKWSLPFFRLVF